GRPDEHQAATMILAFSASGANVVLEAPDAARILLNLAAGRTPGQYSDGQRALLGRVRAIDLDPGDDQAAAALFESQTTRDQESAGAAEGAAIAQGPPAHVGPDVVVVLTGEVDSGGLFADLSQVEEEALKRRFAFEPADLLRHA